MLIKTEGIVLKNRKYGENDSLLTIFTRKAGKVNAIAKGGRKPKSNLLAGIQPFCYSDFVLYKGKSLYTISQCESKEIFYSIREDLTRLSYGAYLLQLVEAVINEGQTNHRLFSLLGKALFLLKKEDIEIQSIIRSFELNYLVYAGYKPHLTSCINCNTTEMKDLRFSIQEGGILCPKCHHTDPFALRVSETTIKLAYYLLNKDIVEIQKLKIHPLLNEQLKKIIKKYIVAHINIYEFKSLDLVDKL
ncbi:DNA repair protein RecO [Alkaliphilus serpentinus]|uniref:DNA repair protein RecO n=1 Tax=Alkaliphilus serpentinus TaxID=1482731 RepID=A0A833MFC8_9FIRM|nr:DNA repair protein RecO [Alkaliphilus serpentinus]KAB3533248.1 DNA repair protein RecO [Alkaliphilus serpentinus]